MKQTGLLIAATMLLLPSAALAAPGMVTTTVGLRAGPGDGFPVVDRIPGGSHVNIHGCLKGDAWCDVSWSDDRGWVSSDALQWLYRNRYVHLSDYYDDIDVPLVTFALPTYWSSYYAHRPFYHRRAYFDRYWHSHESIAMRTPDRIVRARTAHDRAGVTTGVGRGSQARTAIESRNRAAIRERGRGAEARTAIETRSRADLHGRSQLRGAEAARMRGAGQGRLAGVNRNFGQRAPMARAEHGARITTGAAVPARAQIAQPNVSHGSPMNARAQMPAPRAAAPSAPQAGGGRGGGAAHIGGGAPVGHGGSQGRQ